MSNSYKDGGVRNSENYRCRAKTKSASEHVHYLFSISIDIIVRYELSFEGVMVDSFVPSQEIAVVLG